MGVVEQKHALVTEGKKCKGAKKAVVKKGITLEDYKKCVFNQQSKDIVQLCFRTHDHEMFTERISKVQKMISVSSYQKV